jgi:hypothetical protein
MLLTLGGVVCVVSMASLYFNGRQWSEEVQGGNLRIRLRLGVNGGRETPNVCPTLQVLDISTFGDVADVNPILKFLLHTLQHLMVDSSDCLHGPLSQLWEITWHRGQVHTILDVTP